MTTPQFLKMKQAEFDSLSNELQQSISRISAFPTPDRPLATSELFGAMRRDSGLGLPQFPADWQDQIARWLYGEVFTEDGSCTHDDDDDDTTPEVTITFMDGDLVTDANRPCATNDNTRARTFEEWSSGFIADVHDFLSTLADRSTRGTGLVDKLQRIFFGERVKDSLTLTTSDGVNLTGVLDYTLNAPARMAVSDSYTADPANIESLTFFDWLRRFEDETLNLAADFLEDIAGSISTAVGNLGVAISDALATFTARVSRGSGLIDTIDRGIFGEKVKFGESISGTYTDEEGNTTTVRFPASGNADDTIDSYLPYIQDKAQRTVVGNNAAKVEKIGFLTWLADVGGSILKDIVEDIESVLRPHRDFILDTLSTLAGRIERGGADPKETLKRAIFGERLTIGVAGENQTYARGYVLPYSIRDDTLRLALDDTNTESLNFFDWLRRFDSDILDAVAAFLEKLTEQFAEYIVAGLYRYSRGSGIGDSLSRTIFGERATSDITLNGRTIYTATTVIPYRIPIAHSAAIAAGETKALDFFEWLKRFENPVLDEVSDFLKEFNDKILSRVPNIALTMSDRYGRGGGSSDYLGSFNRVIFGEKVKDNQSITYTDADETSITLRGDSVSGETRVRSDTAVLAYEMDAALRKAVRDNSGKVEALGFSGWLREMGQGTLADWLDTLTELGKTALEWVNDVANGILQGLGTVTNALSTFSDRLTRHGNTLNLELWRESLQRAFFGEKTTKLVRDDMNNPIYASNVDLGWAIDADKRKFLNKDNTRPNTFYEWLDRIGLEELSDFLENFATFIDNAVKAVQVFVSNALQTVSGRWERGDGDFADTIQRVIFGERATKDVISNGVTHFTRGEILPYIIADAEARDALAIDNTEALDVYEGLNRLVPGAGTFIKNTIDGAFNAIYSASARADRGTDFIDTINRVVFGEKARRDFSIDGVDYEEDDDIPMILTQDQRDDITPSDVKPRTFWDFLDDLQEGLGDLISGLSSTIADLTAKVAAAVGDALITLAGRVARGTNFVDSVQRLILGEKTKVAITFGTGRTYAKNTTIPFTGLEDSEVAELDSDNTRPFTLNEWFSQFNAGDIADLLDETAGALFTAFNAFVAGLIPGADDLILTMIDRSSRRDGSDNAAKFLNGITRTFLGEKATKRLTLGNGTERIVVRDGQPVPYILTESQRSDIEEGDVEAMEFLDWLAYIGGTALTNAVNLLKDVSGYLTEQFQPLVDGISKWMLTAAQRAEGGGNNIANTIQRVIFGEKLAAGVITINNVRYGRNDILPYAMSADDRRRVSGLIRVPATIFDWLDELGLGIVGDFLNGVGDVYGTVFLTYVERIRRARDFNVNDLQRLIFGEIATTRITKTNGTTLVEMGKFVPLSLFPDERPRITRSNTRSANFIEWLEEVTSGHAQLYDFLKFVWDVTATNATWVSELIKKLLGGIIEALGAIALLFGTANDVDMKSHDITNVDRIFFNSNDGVAWDLHSPQITGQNNSLQFAPRWGGNFSVITPLSSSSRPASRIPFRVTHDEVLANDLRISSSLTEPSINGSFSISNGRVKVRSDTTTIDFKQLKTDIDTLKIQVANLDTPDDIVLPETRYTNRMIVYSVATYNTMGAGSLRDAFGNTPGAFGVACASNFNLNRPSDVYLYILSSAPYWFGLPADSVVIKGRSINDSVDQNLVGARYGTYLSKQRMFHGEGIDDTPNSNVSNPRNDRRHLGYLTNTDGRMFIWAETEAHGNKEADLDDASFCIVDKSNISSSVYVRKDLGSNGRQVEESDDNVVDGVNIIQDAPPATLINVAAAQTTLEGLDEAFGPYDGCYGFNKLTNRFHVKVNGYWFAWQLATPPPSF